MKQTFPASPLSKLDVRSTAREVRWFAHIDRHGPQSSEFLYELTRDTHVCRDTSQRRLQALRMAEYLRLPPQQRQIAKADFNPHVYDLTKLRWDVLSDHQDLERHCRPTGHWWHGYWVLAGEDPYVTLRRDAPNLTYTYPTHLDPDNPAHHRIWRVEFRAGKALLKDRWGIRTWEDLFARFGDLCRETGEVVRYAVPAPDDTNRARWTNHPLWDFATDAINDDLLEMHSGADPNPLKEVNREKHISQIITNIFGCSITVAALAGKTPEELAVSFDENAQWMKDKIRANPAKVEQQLREAKERYVFITKEALAT